MIQLKQIHRHKQDLLADALLIFFTAAMILLIHKAGYLYGSEVDWVSQSSVLPEYFRQKFYASGNLFPDYAMNLGGGQNIYAFSYYGLLSPIILLSYLLPWISMTDYIMAAGIAVVFISGLLVFHWLRAGGFSTEVSFVAAVCFLCAAPVIFQSHRQIMFMDYFPFLLMGLFGVDRFARDRNRTLLILGVFLCIMTSYFFSVGCIAAILIYAVFRFLDRPGNVSFRNLVRELRPIIGGICIAVFMAAVLWLPTLSVILSGRGESGSPGSTLRSLLFPSLWFSFHALLYDRYALGLTGISMAALVLVLLKGKKSERVLSLALLLLLIFPVFSYILNGTLYVRPKALIPFLPLYIFILASFLTKLLQAVRRQNGERSARRRKIFARMLLIFVMGSASLVCLIVNAGDRLGAFLPDREADLRGLLQKNGELWVPADESADVHSPDKLALIQDVLRRDSSFYRMNDMTNIGITSNQVYDLRYDQTSFYTSTGNADYSDFYYGVLHNPIPIRNRTDCVSSGNLLFQSFMDVKYIVAKDLQSVPAGYREIASKGQYRMYENSSVMPLAYATDRLVSRSSFDRLTFPYNVGSLFGSVVVDADVPETGTGKEDKSFSVQKVDLKSDLPLENVRYMSVRKKSGSYSIAAEENASLKIPLNLDLNSRMLILEFQVSAQDNSADLDTWITINGVKNKLSMKSAAYPNGNEHFVYMLSSSEAGGDLSLEFSKGKYEISGIEAYTLPVSEVLTAGAKANPFRVDTERSSGNQIEGDIQITNDGYFATTLPFAKGYHITVDGKTQRYEKVNTAFVGFPIQEGAHHIVIRFEAPWRKTGLALTFSGFLLFGVCTMADRRKYRLLYPQKA